CSVPFSFAFNFPVNKVELGLVFRRSSFDCLGVLKIGNMAEENPKDMKEEVPELAPFDSTKKKKKKKVVIQDPAEEVDKLTEKTESLTGNAVSDPITDYLQRLFVDDITEPSFVGLKKKKKKLNGGDEEGEGIVLGVVRYPWEGTDRDYKYDEVR
ncbi:hypothetical protein B296_00055501, partial [Ensete ventricosum]